MFIIQRFRLTTYEAFAFLVFREAILEIEIFVANVGGQGSLLAHTTLIGGDNEHTASQI